MLRIPAVVFERMDDKGGKSNEDFIVKYKTEIPSISLHIMKEDLKAGRYQTRIGKE